MGNSMSGHYFFLSGAAMFGAWACGAYFLRFWFNTRDRLFLLFGVAFWLMSLERLLLVFIDFPNSENYLYIYLIRLTAFLLILYAIIDKNQKKSKAMSGE